MGPLSTLMTPRAWRRRVISSTRVVRLVRLMTFGGRSRTLEPIPTRVTGVGARRLVSFPDLVGGEGFGGSAGEGVEDEGRRSKRRRSDVGQWECFAFRGSDAKGREDLEVAVDGVGGGGGGGELVVKVDGAFARVGEAEDFFCAAGFGDESAAEKSLEIDGEVGLASVEGAIPGESFDFSAEPSELFAGELKEFVGDAGAFEDGGPAGVDDPDERGSGVSFAKGGGGGEGVNDVAERARFDE